MVELLVRNGDRAFGFVVVNIRNYCRDPFILDGDCQFKLEMIEKNGTTPIIVDPNRWKTMGDAEKEVFIKNEIQFAQ